MVFFKDMALRALEFGHFQDGFRAAAQSVAKELGGRRRGSRWQTAA
jgi:hypothetical protein